MKTSVSVNIIATSTWNLHGSEKTFLMKKNYIEYKRTAVLSLWHQQQTNTMTEYARNFITVSLGHHREDQVPIGGASVASVYPPWMPAAKHTHLRNERLFFSVHGIWIAVRNKQIAWTAKRFSCDLFVPHCDSYPMNREKKDTHSLYLQCLQQRPLLKFSEQSKKFKFPAEIGHLTLFPDKTIIAYSFRQNSAWINGEKVVCCECFHTLKQY